MTAFFNKLLGGSGPAETDNIIPLPDYQTAVQNNHNSHPENPGTPRVNYVRPETLIVTPEGNDGLWPQMPSCDFVTFLAIIQSLGVAILHFEPNLSKNSRRGDRVKVVHLRGGKGMVFKSEFRNQHISESDANRKLLPEIMVLGNPRLNKHPNMHEMLGVTLQPVFDPPRPGMSAAQCAVVPHLVFAECKYGSLWDFVTRSRKRPLSLLQKLRLCSNIAEAVKAMHKLNVVHTDIKPDNVLVFKEGDIYVGKVIDFGFACFGASDTTKVNIPAVSPVWKAPEVHRYAGYGNDQQSFTIGEAKRIDAFSFGKVCAWILFWDDHSLEDLSELSPPFELDTALVRQLLQPERSTGLTDQFVNAMQLKLEGFFHSSYISDPEQRMPFHTLSRQLTGIIRAWEVESGDSFPYTLETKAILDDSWCWIRDALVEVLRFCLRIAAALYSLVRLQRPKAEFFVPAGEVQIVLVPELFDMRVSAFWAVFLPGAIATFAVAFSTDPPPLVIGILVAVLGIGAPFVSVFSWHVWYTRDNYSMLSTAVGPFGHVNHLIPNLPKLLPSLNRLHHSIRDKMVEGLVSYAEGNNGTAKRKCLVCQKRAAQQLAFCARIAFGIFSNPAHTYEHWLALSGQKNVGRLFKEADFWEDRRLGLQDSQDFQVNLAERHTYYDSTSSIISRYKADISKRLESNVCLPSAVVLQDQLAMVYSVHSMHQDAEQAFREAAKMEREVQSRSGMFRLGFKPRVPLRLGYEEFQRNIAMELSKQGKVEEAIELTRALPVAMIVPRVWRWFNQHRPTKSEYGWYSDLLNRTLLMKLLVQQERPVEAIQSGLVETLYAGMLYAQKYIVDNDWVVDPEVLSAALQEIKGAGKRLLGQNKIPEAVFAFRHLVALHGKLGLQPSDKDAEGTDVGNGDEDDYRDDESDMNYHDQDGQDHGHHGDQDEDPIEVPRGSGHELQVENRLGNTADTGGERRAGRVTEVMGLELQLSICLALSSDPQEIQEALAIQNRLLPDTIHSGAATFELELRTIRSLALFRGGQRQEGIEEMDGVMQRKQQEFGDSHLACLGFMADLAGSLCLDGKAALETPARIQREFLILARGFVSQPATQERIITLLWTFSRADFLHEAIDRTEELLSHFKTVHPSEKIAILNIKSHLAFVLAHFGFTFGERGELDKALVLVDEVIAERSSIATQPVELMPAMQLRAAVYARLSNLLLGAQGFGTDDMGIFHNSITAHQAVVKVAESCLASTDRQIADARARLALALSDLSRAFGRDEDLSEAIAQLDQAIESYATPEESVQLVYYKYALRAYHGHRIVFSKLHAASEKMRHWLLGVNSEGVHAGDLALQTHLISLFSPRTGDSTTSSDHRQKLTLALSRYSRLRAKWSTNPDLHPDVILAEWDRGVLMAGEFMPPYKEQYIMRNVRLRSLATYPRSPPQHAVDAKCAMSLAVATSNDPDHVERSIKSATTILQDTVAQLRSTQHTQAAKLTASLAFILSKSDRRSESIQRYKEALDSFLVLHDPQHPHVMKCARYLLHFQLHVAGIAWQPLRDECIRDVFVSRLPRTAINMIRERNMERLYDMCFLFGAGWQWLGETHPVTEGCRSKAVSILERGGVGPATVQLLLQAVLRVDMTGRGR